MPIAEHDRHASAHRAWGTAPGIDSNRWGRIGRNDKGKQAIARFIPSLVEQQFEMITAIAAAASGPYGPSPTASTNDTAEMEQRRPWVPVGTW